ncbi:GNAT family N-acetyltransferase [Flavobacterium sp. SM2513]|uniref:GNAT family N-acetyltransferase n=1 Tax=Flavobacterium sp. SM2513 TaxID=3424766 RepID=UPI003D7F1BC9
MNLNTPTIRLYESHDKFELLHLLDLNTPTYFAASERADLEHYLENERELYYVISFENQIIGCGGINFEEEKTIAIISWDIIHPDYQGKSFGSLLLKHRLSELQSITTIQKIIVRTSQLTHLFYEKHGFVLKEKITDYWALGFDLYYMEYLEF